MADTHYAEIRADKECYFKAWKGKKIRTIINILLQ